MASLAIFAYLFLNLMNGAIRPISNIVFSADPATALASIIFYRGAWAPALLPVGVLLIGSLALGRVFCGWICPVGFLVDVMDIPSKATSKLLRRKTPNRRFGHLQYGILAVVALSSPLTMIALSTLDPFAIFKRTMLEVAHFGWPDVILLALLGSVIVVPRFWCRAICPAGAILGLASVASPFRFNAKSGCKSCLRCSNACRMGAISGDLKWDATACIKCLECTRSCPADKVSFSIRRPASRLVPSIAREPQMAPISKRSLLTAGAMLGLLAISKGTVASSAGVEKPLIRPPGSLVEDRFNAACIRCGSCVQACPMRINPLELIGLGYGLEKVGTPRLNFNKYLCCGCSYCADACPTGAIVRLPAARIKLGTAVIDRSACTSSAVNRCLACKANCAKRAIANDGRYGPVVIEELCKGCGKCVRLCPDHAIEVTNKGEVRREA